MEEKKKIGNAKLLVIAIVLILVVIIGTTYAWYRITRSSDTINKIKAGSLEMTLDDTATEGIKLLNEVPKSYSQVMKTEEYTFTLTNTGTTTNDYTIYLDDVLKFTDDQGKEITITDDTKLEDTKIRYILLKDGESAASTKSKLLSAATERIIDTGKIDKNQTIKYSLRMWIDSRAENEVMGKMFNAKLRVEASQSTTNEEPEVTKLCKRATTLHTETCSNTDTTGYCQADGYALKDTITYGNLGTTGTLTSGDAFDCDVNGDGVYDSATERFYYVSDMTNGVTQDSNTAVLIYYNNVSGGVASNSTAYAYDESGKNNNGPVTVIKQLPTSKQWSNVSLTNTIRTITNQSGGNTTNAGNLPTAFSYEGYAARLLTAQEVSTGCVFTVGSYTKGELSSKCKYLMENTKYSSSSLRTYGGWLESPDASDSFSAWIVYAYGRNVNTGYVDSVSNFGVRPAIEVAKTNIDY